MITSVGMSEVGRTNNGEAQNMFAELVDRYDIHVLIS
jgi:hypothetical protein